MEERYFEDFAEGEVFLSRGYTLSEADIISFASVYDPQPFHIDKQAAEEGPYNGLIASGFQTLGVTFRMFHQLGLVSESSMGGPGIDELRWLRPVRPGDTLRARVTVAKLSESTSKPDRGYITWAFETLNQIDEVVMTFRPTMILAKRGAAEAPE